MECQRVQPRIDSIRDETVAYLKEHKSSEIIKLYVMGDEIQFHVTMTLVYRALPAPEGSHSRFCNECLESARKAMVLHKESIGLMNYGTFIKTIYVHWSVDCVSRPFHVSGQTDLFILKEPDARALCSLLHPVLLHGGNTV